MKRFFIITALIVIMLFGGETVSSANAFPTVSKTACCQTVATSATPVSDYCQMTELRAGGGGGGGGGSSGLSFFSRRTFRRIRRKIRRGQPLNISDYAIIFFGVIILPVLFIGSIVSSVMFIRKKRKNRKTAKKMLEKLSKTDNKWKYDHLVERVSKAYFAIQKAWTNGDMTKAKEYMTPELIELHQQRLDSMRKTGERNVLKNIKLKNYYAAAVYDSPDDEFDNVWFLIEGSMVDYIYNDELKRITSGTTNVTKFEEYWKFVRNESGDWVLAKIVQKNDTLNLPKGIATP